MSGRNSRPMRPLYRHGVTALLFCLAGALVLILLFRPSATWFHYLAAWLLSINVVAFVYYGYDKSCARSASRRGPEAVLDGLAVAGGSLGAYAGMQGLRHKTLKGKVRISFWVRALM